MNTRSISIAKYLAIIVALMTVLGTMSYHLVDSRWNAEKARAKGTLTHVWYLVRGMDMSGGQLPGTVHFSDNQENTIAQSWRLLLIQSLPYDRRYVKKYDMKQQWDSK